MSDQAYNSNFNDDFEKVDPDNYGAPDQDENITSSSMPGDMAEEDRYQTNEQDLLGDFSVGGSMPISDRGSDVTPQGQPLISFGDNSPESSVTASAPSPPKPQPTEFKPEPKPEPMLATPTEGCWMKTVDPRDESSDISEPLVTTMEEQPSTTDTADLSASATAAGPVCGEINGGQIRSDTDVLEVEKDIESSDAESSQEESSSSANDSESENSDLESSENEGTYDIDNFQEQTVDLETKMDVANPEYEETLGENNNTEDGNEAELSERQSSETESSAVVEQTSETTSDFEDELMPESVSQAFSENSAETGAGNHAINSEDIRVVEPLDPEKTLPDALETRQVCVSELDEIALSANDASKDSLLQSGSGKIDLVDTNHDPDSKATTGDVPVTENDLNVQEFQTEEASRDMEDSNVMEYKPMGLSEDDMSSILDKLTSEQEEPLESVEMDDFLDNIKPPVFDQEKMIASESVSSGGNSSDDESADNSEREDEDEDSSIDSDISGDEPVFGVWNPSPLHNENLDDREDDDMEEDDMDEGSSDNAADTSVLSGYKYLEATDESNSTSGKDVYSMQDNKAETHLYPSSMNSGKRRKELSKELFDQCHVKFHTPTNTIFYDPESPVVERVAVEYEDNLVDCDDEAKDVEQEKESATSEGAKDVKSYNPKDFSFYSRKDEQDHELEGAMELIKDTGLDELALLASQMKAGKRKEIWDDFTVDSDMKGETEEESDITDLSEVVLRRKNDKNVSDDNMGLDRDEVSSMIIHEIDDTVEASLEQDVIESVCEAPERTIEASEIVHNKADDIVSDVTNTITTDLTSIENEIHVDESERISVNKETYATHDDALESPDVNVTEDFANYPMKRIEGLASDIASNIINDIAVECHDKNEATSSIEKSVADTNEIDMVNDSETSFNTSLQNMETNVIDDDSQLHFKKDKNTADVAEISTVPSSSAPVKKQGKNVVEEDIAVETIIAGAKAENTSHTAGQKEAERSSFRERVSAMVLRSTSEVLDIIYWRDLKTTGVVFGSMMFVLLSLSCCSLLSVLAYLSLAILTVTFSFRVYKSVMQAVQKTNDGHPFKKLLDLEIRLSDDVVQAAAQKIADNMNNCCAELRRLYLVGDYIDSLKFGLLLWLLTYVGAWFNGMTLIILVVVSIFTIPKVYETYQGPIDQNVNLVRAQLNNIMAQVSAKIPFPKKKAKTQ